MSLTAAASGFVVFLLSVQVIQAQNGWGVTYTSTEICAVKGSTVEMSCTYSYPSRIDGLDITVEETFWFTKLNGERVDVRTDSQYAGRVQYSCYEKSCTLRITDLRERDSAKYQFRFITNQPSGRYSGSPGITLSVKVLPDLQVWVRRSSDSSRTELKCHSSCHIPDQTSYIWHKNGQKLQAETSSSYLGYFNSPDSYSCAVKAHEDSPSPSVYAPRVPSVSVSPSGEIVEGSSVTLTCSSDANPAAKYTWYNANVNLKPLSKEPQLVFRSIQSSDSGEYYCTAENELGGRTSAYISVDVKYAPKTSSVSVSPSGETVEGSSVTLTCSSDANPAAKYTWYKANRDLDLQPLSKEPQLVFKSIQSSDSGEYYCTAENKLGAETSGYISIDVKYAPKLPSVSVSPSGEIVEGNSVTLTCSSDANPAAKYVWHKTNGDVDLQPLSKEPQLVFKSIQSSDSREYYCTAENKLGAETSGYISIDVKYAPKLPYVSVSPSGEIVEGSSVNLICSSNANPAAKYAWYKTNGDVDLQPLSKEPQLAFKSIQSSDSGEYYCIAENKLGGRTSGYISVDVNYAPKTSSVSVSPSGETVEGSSVTLTCSSDANPAAKYTWYKANRDLDLQPLSKEPQLVFKSIQSSDSGEYYCTAENKLGAETSGYISIDVKYAPKLPSVSVSPSGEIVEGNSVTLTCSSDANPAAKYVWHKTNGDVDLQPLSKEPQLVFKSIQSSDSGEYYCTAENKLGAETSGYVSIYVKYAPKLLSVSVSPSGEIVEGSSVTLTCSSDANPAANYTWYKDIEDSSKASGQNFTITDFRAEHSGNYYCEAKNTIGRHNSTSHLIVVTVSPLWNSTMIILIIRFTLVVVMPIPLLVFSLWMRKKKTLSSTTEPNEPIETIELESEPVYVNVTTLKKDPAAGSRRFE